MPLEARVRCMVVTIRHGTEWLQDLTQFLITVYILALFLTLDGSLDALSLLSLLSLTSPLVPASNGGMSPSWVPELSPCHNHSNS
jgi:hypothetical protein